MRDGSEPGDRDEDVEARPPSPVEPDSLDPDDGAQAATEPTDAAPPPQPPPAPARSVFVVAAPQNEPPSSHAVPAEPGPTVEDDAADSLFIVPAVQPPSPAPPEARTRELEPAPTTPIEPGPVIMLEPERESEPERRRRFWRPGCFTILLLLVVAVVAGGVYAYQTRTITPRLVLEAVGFGAAEVDLVNLRDDAVRVDLATGGADDVVPASFRLAALEIRAHRAPRPTQLRLALTAEDGTRIGSCALDLASGDRIEVVLLPDQTLIRRAETVPASGRDLLIGESSLCR